MSKEVLLKDSTRGLASIGVLAAVLLALSGCGDQPQGFQPPPPEVAVKKVDAGAVPLELTYTARTVGSREVEVRARVGGILLKRRFEEGSRVQEGQSLFQIDPEPIRAHIASAAADVAVAKARLDEARREKDRVVPLFEKNAVSQSRRDEVVSGFDVAEANLKAAEAALQMAKLDLGYSNVRAPIGGLTSRENVSEGSLIALDKDSSLLTRIVQIDPLYVEFSVPEAEAMLLRSALAPTHKGPVPMVKLLLEDGSEYADAAKLTFIDNAVDVNSGTVRVRAVLQNKLAQLIPGQFVRAHVEGISLANVMMVPRKAVMSGPQGHFVWLVGADDKVEIRPVQTGRSFGNDIIVTTGLKGGERFIVEGVLKVQPGIQVSAVSADANAAAAKQAAEPAKPVQKAKEQA